MPTASARLTADILRKAASMSAFSHIVLIDDNPRDRAYYADRLQAMFPESVVVQATTGRNGSLIANAHQETPFDGQVHGCWGDRRHCTRAAVAQFPIKFLDRSSCCRGGVLSGCCESKFARESGIQSAYSRFRTGAEIDQLLHWRAGHVLVVEGSIAAIAIQTDLTPVPIGRFEAAVG